MRTELQSKTLKDQKFPFQLPFLFNFKHGHHILLSSPQAFHRALRGRVMSACLLELRNAYNKLETLTTLHLKWFQMLRQTAERRAHGSPPPLVLKKAVFKKKTIIIVLRHFPKYKDNFSQHHTNVSINTKLNSFLTKLKKNFLNKKFQFQRAFQ